MNFNSFAKHVDAITCLFLDRGSIPLTSTISKFQEFSLSLIKSETKGFLSSHYVSLSSNKSPYSAYSIVLYFVLCYTLVLKNHFEVQIEDAMARNKLTDTKVKNSKAEDKDYVLADGGNLQILIKTNGSKLWEVRYRFGGKSKKTTIGNYPSVSLNDARTKRDEWAGLVAKGIDPIKFKKQQEHILNLNVKGQFHNVVEEWIPTIRGLSEAGKQKLRRAFERDIYPYWSVYDSQKNIVSSRHISQITSADIIDVIGAKQKTAPESAYRLFGKLKDLWEYAIAKDYCENYIFIKIPKKMFSKLPPKHYSKITDEVILGRLLRDIETYNNAIVRSLLQFVAYVPLRAENLCALRWEQIDFEEEKIVIPRASMKIKNPQLGDFELPLSHQAIRTLEGVRPFTGWGEWVFCGTRDQFKPILNETPNKALRLLGYDGMKGRPKQTLHSFRGTFRSLADTYQTEHNASFEAKERALDHHEKSITVRAYAHQANYFSQMRELLQWWANFLDRLKEAR